MATKRGKDASKRKDKERASLGFRLSLVGIGLVVLAYVVTIAVMVLR